MAASSSLEDLFVYHAVLSVTIVGLKRNKRTEGETKVERAGIGLLTTTLFFELSSHENKFTVYITFGNGVSEH